ncbi:MAG: Rne/Rng family ribonuclease [Planctomycetes bacterium]|nr:Rne/Rng family ribonuclease [Planctomycetota bacterium]
MSLADIARAAAAEVRAEQMAMAAKSATAPQFEVEFVEPLNRMPGSLPRDEEPEIFEGPDTEVEVVNKPLAPAFPIEESVSEPIDDRGAPQLVEFDEPRPAENREFADVDAASTTIEVDVDDESATPGVREMVINVSEGSEVRIAVLHEGRLEELFIERESAQSHVGNIYKGRVTNVEPSIQAAFVDFGLQKNGFLHISDVQPQYFPNHSGAAEDVGRKIPRHHRPPIQKCFRRGEEVIVQIIKEGVGTKGPTLTSYVSIPGRFLVMMPGMSRHGVSRKIEDEESRRKMRDILNELDLPQNMGFILRTAGMDRTKRDLQRDFQYLMRLWRTVVDRIKREPAPAELYRESDLVIRTIRDVYNADFKRIVIDDPATASRVNDFLQIAMPRTRTQVDVYTEREPLFHHTGIEAEIEKINMRHVPLKSGGSLVIDSTEALVAIDVNSGRFRTIDDAEETAVRINVEAAEEIARQLRLRDLGGLIVCDFIDMRLDRNKRKVEQALREALKKHKERARILRMSAFGLIEMTRQRQGPSIKRNIYYDCPHCRGSGLVKMPESVMLDAMRTIQLCVHNPQVQKVAMTLSADVAFQLLNQKRDVLNRIESETGKDIVIRGDQKFTSDQMEFACEDNRGRPVAIG